MRFQIQILLDLIKDYDLPTDLERAYTQVFRHLLSIREELPASIIANEIDLMVYKKPNPKTGTVPDVSDLLVHLLGPNFAELAHEMRDWHPLIVLNEILMPGADGRCIVEIAKSGDTEALQQAVEHIRDRK